MKGMGAQISHMGHKSCKLHIVNKGFGSFKPSFDTKCDDSAASFQVFFCQDTAFIRLQKGVSDPGHFAVPCKMLGNP